MSIEFSFDHRHHHRHRRRLNRSLPSRFLPFKLFCFNNIIFYQALILLQACFSHSMRLVIQRVKSASVTVENEVISSIGPGILGLVGLHEHDTLEDLEFCRKKLLGAKIWENVDCKPWNLK
mmetsp:Transcript_40209/g.47047  ORF Transcript_40209/g.47047 Transcript_40209/m.47047 type:complete len:121 (+) Transcript_40209:11-373(+)